MDNETDEKGGWLYHKLDGWFYGFARYNAGQVVEILDLDGFIYALQAERPDLPVVGFGKDAGEEESDDRSTSFYQGLRSMLRAPQLASGDSVASTLQRGESRRPCRLIALERAKMVIESFVASNMPS